MKVLIIGLDGLDYRLVTRWNMDIFKQKIYGMHYVGFLKTLYTPIIWGCFLTGRDITREGYNLKVLKKKRSEEAFPRFLRPFYKLKKKLLGSRTFRMKEILRRLGLVKRYPPSIMPKDLLKKTFLEKVRAYGYSICAIEIPSYNERLNEKYRTLYINYISASLKKKLMFLQEVKKDCYSRIKQTLEAVMSGVDLIFVYLPLPDIGHHLLFKGIKERIALRIHYGEIRKMITPLIRKASSKEYLILVVSDHGFDIKKYTHSEYGFWSLNLDTDWRPEQIIDFYPKILEWIDI